MHRVKSKKVVEASGMPEASLRRYLDRGLIPIDVGDLAHLGTGTPRQFGLRTVLRVALVHACVISGIKPATALRLAGLFLDDQQPGRERGELFPSGRTLIFAESNDTARIINIAPDRLLDEMLCSEAAIVVDVGRIARRVHMQLGLTGPDDIALVLAEFRNQHESRKRGEEKAC